MKKFKIILLATLLISSYVLLAQVSVNTDGSSADASAMLDVKSTTSGFLAPRMTASERGLIPSPAEGLMVYQTDGASGYYYYDGFSWVQFFNNQLAQGKIFIGNASGTAAEYYLSGDVSLSETGITAIGYGKVTNDMLSGSITNDKLAGGISNDKLAGSITGDKLAMAQGKIFIGNAFGAAEEQNITGDVTLSETGITSIGYSKVTNNMLSGSITNDKLAGGITNDKLANGTYMITSAGSSGQVWTSDGSGAGTWAAAGGGSSVSTQTLKFLICIDGTWPSGNVSDHFIGEIIMFAGQSYAIPDNFMECQGQLLSISAYPALYAVLGTTYGGNGTTTFALPDMTGKVPEGN